VFPQQEIAHSLGSTTKYTTAACPTQTPMGRIALVHPMFQHHRHKFCPKIFARSPRMCRLVTKNRGSERSALIFIGLELQQLTVDHRSCHCPNMVEIVSRRRRREVGDRTGGPCARLWLRVPICLSRTTSSAAIRQLSHRSSLRSRWHWSSTQRRHRLLRRLQLHYADAHDLSSLLQCVRRRKGEQRGTLGTATDNGFARNGPAVSGRSAENMVMSPGMSTVRQGARY